MAYNSLGTSITFVDRTTVVPTPWVQDVNNVVYQLLGNGTNAPTSVQDILVSLGINPVTVTKTVVSATLGQTSFAVASYVPGTNALSCFINGVRQTSSAYMELNATTVVFASGATSAGDVYEFVATNVVIAGGYTLPIASAGVLGGIKVGTGLSIDGSGILSATGGGSGTVTSVAASSSSAGLSISGSPITSSGTLAFGLNAELNGLAGIASNGIIARTGAGTYGQRTVTAGTGISVTNGDGVAGNPTIANTGVTSIVAGSGISISGATGAVTVTATGGGTGTVTSVGLTAPVELSVGGSPVTTSGTLAMSWQSQSQNLIFASPVGSAGTPTFRSIAAADLPTVTVAKGGTNLTSLGTANQVLGVNNGASAMEYKTVTAGTNISVTHGVNSITIATSGLGTMAAQNASAVAITGGTASAVTLTAHREKVITANSTTAYTVNAATGEAWKLTMTGNCTLTLSGQSSTDLTPVTLYLIQDATGTRTMTWPASVKWGTAGAPTLSTAAGKIDIVTLFTLDNGTTWIGSYRLGF